jgi:thioredoxin-related protein
MNRAFFTIFLLSSILIRSIAQDSISKPYHPEADANAQITKAVQEASLNNKHVLIMIGGNWCKWCLMLTKYMAQHEVIDSVMKADYVYIHVNYSKENKNSEVMKQLEFPQRFGFPVLVVLDGTGKKIHTQNTVYFEKDESYSEEIIRDFLVDWNYKSLHPVE